MAIPAAGAASGVGPSAERTARPASAIAAAAARIRAVSAKGQRTWS
jgi:hypothetical protein